MKIKAVILLLDYLIILKIAILKTFFTGSNITFSLGRYLHYVDVKVFFFYLCVIPTVLSLSLLGAGCLPVTACNVLVCFIVL